MSNIENAIRDELGKYATTHNLTSHDFYPIWRAMTNRCFNPNNGAYARYGGRGISICSEWADSPVAFIAWLEANGYSSGLQIDRKDNDFCIQMFPLFPSLSPSL